MPFGKGLLNLFRKDFWKKVDPIARFDVVVLGSVMHDLALKTPFETYAANLRRVVAWIRQVRRKRASVRFIWLGGTKSALEPNCLFLAWDNQLPSLVKFANRIAEQIMRQAGIETFDIYSLMSSSEPSWYYGYGAGRQVGHLAQCYEKPAINTSARQREMRNFRRTLGAAAHRWNALRYASAASAAQPQPGVYGGCAAEAGVSEASGSRVSGCPRAPRYFNPYHSTCGTP